MNKFFFIDMEMTGLDVESNRIIEVAVIVTDLEFHELERYQAIIRQPQEFIDAMDEWNVNTHTESGLITEISRGRLQQEVEMDLAISLNATLAISVSCLPVTPFHRTSYSSKDT